MKIVFKSEVGMCANNRNVMHKRKNEAWESYKKAQEAYERSVDAHEKAEADLARWEKNNALQ